MSTSQVQTLSTEQPEAGASRPQLIQVCRPPALPLPPLDPPFELERTLTPRVYVYARSSGLARRPSSRLWREGLLKKRSARIVALHY